MWLDPLCIWHRPAAASLIQRIAWDLPQAVGAALKRKRKKKEIVPFKMSIANTVLREQTQKQHFCQLIFPCFYYENLFYIMTFIFFPIITGLQYSVNFLLYSIILFFCFFFVVFVLGPHLQHMEVPRLGVKSELRLPAYATAIAMQDPSHVCDLHHTSRQCQILNPPNEAAALQILVVLAANA